MTIVACAHARCVNRRRAKKSSNPVGMASHHRKPLAVGVCGGWLTVTERVTGGVEALVDGVLGTTSTCPGEKTQRALAGRDDARQPNPTIPVQPP